MNKIKLSVIRCNRKTLAIQIKKDFSVEVRAPLFMSDDSIQRFIDSHRKWISTHIRLMQEKAKNRQAPFTDSEIQAMKEETLSFLPALIAEYAPRLQVQPARITVRCQKTRWGSCSSKANLSFNCLVALAPDHVRKYVVIHELCHLKEMNHSPAFWRLLASQMPDYQKAKEWLKAEGQTLISRLPV